MIKKYIDFINESVPGPNTQGKKISLSEDDVNLFNDEPVLQKLVADQKVGLFNDEVWYNESDEKTKEILDQYLEVPGKVEESMSNDEEISESEINEFLQNGIRVPVFLTDLLSDTNLILLMTNGEIYERKAGNKKFDIYSSKDEFKSKTGASLDDEYAGNASPALINLFDEVDDYRGGLIEMAYIDSQFDNPLLESILKNFE